MTIVLICMALIGVATVAGVGLLAILVIKQMIRDILLKGGMVFMSLLMGTGSLAMLLFGLAVA